MSPEELQEKRFQFMYTLYKLSGPNSYQSVNLEQILRETNLTEREADLVGQQLFRSRLIWQPLSAIAKLITQNASWKEAAREVWSRKSPIRITAGGIIATEEAYFHRKGVSIHQQSPINYNFGDNAVVNSKVSNSNIQQGKNAHQSLSVSQKNELREIIEELRQITMNESLPPEPRQELSAEMEAIENHTKSANPDKGFLSGKFGTILRILAKLEPLILSPTVIDRIQNWIATLRF